MGAGKYIFKSLNKEIQTNPAATRKPVETVKAIALPSRKNGAGYPWFYGSIFEQ
jgi:hypothetical protein